jgi:hypothetical protein
MKDKYIVTLKESIGVSTGLTGIKMANVFKCHRFIGGDKAIKFYADEYKEGEDSFIGSHNHENILSIIRI